MELISQQTQGLYGMFPSRTVSWTSGVKLKPPVSPHFIGRFTTSTSLMRHLCLRISVPPILQLKVKHLKISDFKGRGRSNGPRFHNGLVKISSVLHEGEETKVESPEIQKVSHSYTKGEETIVGSPVIQKLLKKWLMMLHTESSIQVTDGIFGSTRIDVLEGQNDGQRHEARKILPMAWYYFLGMDATIKIPILIFIPLYLAVNVVYGVEVSKELIPLWVFGPLIVALYIKILVFILKKIISVMKSLQAYYLLVYNYMALGKLKDDLRTHFWQPLVYIKNMNYIELSKRKLKELEEWAVEKYLDYVESIWPYYCRTIRSLKKANLI